MKPILIIAGAVFALVAFVFLMQVPGNLEASAIAKRQQDSMDRQMQEYRCNLQIVANPDDAKVRELCDQIKRLNAVEANRLSTPG